VTSKQALEALPDDLRSMLLLGGHIVNELTTITRLLVFSGKSFGDEIESAYAGIQYLTLIRLATGQAAEGLEVFQKRILGTPLGKTYLPLVTGSKDGNEAVTTLRKAIGGSGLLRRLRNAHTFHNPSDKDLKSAFNALGDDEDWSVMMGVERHTMAFRMSYVVTTRALLDETGESDARKAIEKWRDEVLGVSNALTTFFEYLTLAADEAHGLFSKPYEAVKDTSLLPAANEVKIPPICGIRKR